MVLEPVARDHREGDREGDELLTDGVVERLRLENAMRGWSTSSVVTSKVRARANVASTNPIARSNSPVARVAREAPSRLPPSHSTE